MEPAPLTLRLQLDPDPHASDALEALLHAFTTACAQVRAAALQAGTRDRGRLHALVYRTLCPKPVAGVSPPGVPLPSQYAVLALGRALHQLRLHSRSKKDPYPKRSFDVDSRVLSLDPVQALLRITPLTSYGLRGGAALYNRLSIPFRLDTLPKSARKRLLEARFIAGTISLPTRGTPTLLARLELAPDPPPAT